MPDAPPEIRQRPMVVPDPVRPKAKEKPGQLRRPEPKRVERPAPQPYERKAKPKREQRPPKPPKLAKPPRPPKEPFVRYKPEDIETAVAKRIMGTNVAQIAREMGIGVCMVNSLLRQSDSPELAAAIAAGWKRNKLVDGVRYCQNGHAMTPDNVAPRYHEGRGGGYCLICNRHRNRTTKKKRELVAAEYTRGISVDSIAFDHGLSTQQVYRLLRGMK